MQAIEPAGGGGSSSGGSDDMHMHAVISAVGFVVATRLWALVEGIGVMNVFRRKFGRVVEVEERQVVMSGNSGRHYLIHCLAWVCLGVSRPKG